MDVYRGDEPKVLPGTNVQLWENRYKVIGELYPSQTFQVNKVSADTVSRLLAHNMGADFYARIEFNGTYLQTAGYVNDIIKGLNVTTTRTLSDDPRQIWHFTRDSYDGSYKIVNEYSGWCLDVESNQAVNNANIWVERSQDMYSARSWYCVYSPGDATYRLVSALKYPSELYSVDIPNSSTAESTNVELFTQQWGANQQFKIQAMSYAKPGKPAVPRNAQVISNANGTTIMYDSVPEASAYDDRAYEFQLFNRDTGEDVLGGQYRTGLTTYFFDDIVLPDGEYELRVRAVNRKYSYTSSNYASGYLVTYFTIQNNHTITVSVAAGTTGTGTVSGSGTYQHGQTVTVRATPSRGSRFGAWMGPDAAHDISTSPEYTFTATRDQELIAYFYSDASQYSSIRVFANTGGTVRGGGAYLNGDSTTITATPSTGYTFKEWQENGVKVSDSASYTFAVTTNRELTAVFEKTQPDTPEVPKVDCYTIRLDTQPVGIGSVTGGGIYEANEQVTVEASSPEGYRFTRWTENGAQVSGSAAYTFAATADRNLIAVFEEEGLRTIQVSATPGGTASGGGIYSDGSSVTVTAIANSGYRFVGWKSGGTQVSTDAVYTFNATADQDLIAVFEQIGGSSSTLLYEVETVAGSAEGGTVSGGGRYEAGATVTVLAEANPGYQFVGWTQDGNTVSTDARYTFAVNENRHLTAVFETKQCTIAADADPAEGGTVSGGGVYERGRSATLTAVPSSGYRFVEWQENGTQVSTLASYTFLVNRDRTLTAVFAQGEEEPDQIHVSVQKTDIRANSVFNNGSYGSITLNGDIDDYDGDNLDSLTLPQIGLIDRNGTFVFPYQEDSIDNAYFGGGTKFRYSNGIVSRTLGSAYNNGDLPRYYNLDGSSAFTLEETENEYTDENGVFHQDSTSYLGGPMTDGYAVVIQKLYSFWSGGGAGGGDSAGENKTQIINQNGAVTCELPQEFNEDIQWGAGGFTTKMSLGWCGEGLFAFFENTPGNYAQGDYNIYTVGKGYMDASGQTVIDLSARGFIDLYPFHQGLAAVKDQNGKFGFIDKTGALVIPCEYEGRYDFGSSGLCPVKKDGKWGYIDKDNNIVIPFGYDNAFGAEDGLAAVAKDGKYGLIDYDGNVIVPFEYDDISTYEGGVAYGIKDGIVYIITASAAPNMRTISVSASPAVGGTVTGGGSYRQGASVTVTAVAGSNYRFVRWTENGAQMSTNASYTFTVEADRTLVAEFTYTGSSGRPSYSDSGSASSPATTLPVKTDKGGSGNKAETTASPSATVNNGKAVCAVSTAIADEMVKQAIDNNSKSVTVSPVINGTVNSTEVSIPSSAVKQLGENTSADLMVATPVGSVTIPNNALTELSGGSNMSVAMEKNGTGTTLTITADGQTVKEVSGGVTLEVPTASSTPGTVAVLVGKDGTRQIIRKSVVIDGSVVVPLDGSAKIEIVDNAKTFADVPSGNWAADAVAFASGHELFNGTSEDAFSPNIPMTRGMLAVVLHNLENNPVSGSGSVFSDVFAGTWYEEAVSWAEKQSIITGYGDGRFGPSDNITREQLAVIMWRYGGSPTVNSDALSSFSDTSAVSSYAIDALNWAVESSVINGTGDGHLDPKGFATRAQVAQMFMNYLTK